MEQKEETHKNGIKNIESSNFTFQTGLWQALIIMWCGKRVM